MSRLEKIEFWLMKTKGASLSWSSISSLSKEEFESLELFVEGI